jgi:hypothetical protein
MIQSTSGSTYQYGSSEHSAEQLPSPTEKLLEYFTEYARERPEVVALWAFGIGFVLGWKLKPW